jgi:hypothetical protein
MPAAVPCLRKSRRDTDMERLLGMAKVPEKTVEPARPRQRGVAGTAAPP